MEHIVYMRQKGVSEPKTTTKRKFFLVAEGGSCTQMKNRIPVV